MSKFSGPFNRQTDLLDRIADAITGSDELDKPTGSRALDSLERLAIWFEAHGGIPSSPGSQESNAILYDSKAAWDAKRDLISERGTIYIYSDYQTIEDENGEVITIPGIKVGDGLAYLVDLPIANQASNEHLVTQIANRVAEMVTDTVTENVVGDIRNSLEATSSLVSSEDRERWDGKVKTSVNETDPENLIFSY